MSADPGRDLVFISYSHANPVWRDRLLVLLKPFVRRGELQVWADTDIEAGALWRREIDAALARTCVGVVLLTSDLLASDFIAGVELPSLLGAAAAHRLKLLIVPIEAVPKGATRFLERDLAEFKWPWNPQEPLDELPPERRNRALVTVIDAIVEAVGSRAQDASGFVNTKLIERSPSLRDGRMGELYGVPPLPPHHLTRDQPQEALKQSLLGRSAVVGVSASAARVGLHGQGGLGKTVVAQAVAMNEEVRDAFPDGIYWITVGQQPRLESLQAQLAEWCGERVSVEDVATGTRVLGERLRGKVCLVVLDDVWQFAHAKAFDVLDGGSRLLVTTRDRSILTALAARDVHLDALPRDLALELLARWAALDVTELAPEASEIAKEVAYLPLALALAGALVRDGGSWADVLTALRRGDLVFLDHPYGSVFKSIQASVNALDPEDASRYVELAVFPEDVEAPVTIVEQLWHATSGDDPLRVRARLRRLAARNLLQLRAATDSADAIGSSDPGRQRTESVVTLHDLLHDFVRLLVQDLRTLHNRLVDAWHAELPRSEDADVRAADRWADLPSIPAYRWQFLAYHLRQAGRDEELERLLTSPDWLFARLTRFSVPALLADYREAKPDLGLRSIHDALVLSIHAISRDPAALTGQLAGRLLNSPDPRIQFLVDRSPTPLRHRPMLRPCVACLDAPGGPLLQTFDAHGSGVTAVTVLPDGQQALSGGRDRTLKLWDLTTGTVLGVLEGHDGEVTALTVLPDARRVLSSGEDGTLRLSDLTTGAMIRTFRPRYHHRILAMTVLLDGRALLGISGEAALSLFDLVTDTVVQRFEGHDGAVLAVAVLPDGRRVLTGSGDGTLRLWDLTTGAVLQTFVGHDAPVTAVSVLSDGPRALSASEDGTLKLWDLAVGTVHRTFVGHGRGGRAMTVLPDGRRALSGSEDGTLQLWDLDSGTKQTLEGHSRSVTALARLPDGQRALSGSADGTLKLWDLDRVAGLRRSERHHGAVLALSVLPGSRRALSGGADGTLKLWDLKAGVVLQTFEGHSLRVTAVTALPDGQRALSLSQDGTLKLWDLTVATVLRTFPGDSGGRAVTVLPDGRRALSVRGSSSTMKLWDLTTGTVLQTFSAFVEPYPSPLSAVTLLPGGSQVLSFHDDGTLRLWDVGAGRRLQKFEGHGSGRAVTVLPDGQQALTAHYDGTLRLWDLTSGTVLRTLQGHSAEVTAVTALPDGRRAISCSQDRTLKLWDVVSGAVLCTFYDEAPINCLSVTDDLRIVAGNALGRVSILRVG